MKKLAIVLMGIFLATMAYADIIAQRVQDSNRADTIAVHTTNTVYSRSFPLITETSSGTIGVMYKMSPATGDTKILFEQSFRRPSTEGSADTAYVMTDTIDSSVAGTSAWEMATIDSVEMPYGRFQIIGQGSNPYTTVLEIHVGVGR